MDDIPPITTAQQFAELIGVSERTVARWCNDHNLPFRLRGGIFHVPTLEAVLWILSRRAFAADCDPAKLDALRGWSVYRLFIVRDTCAISTANHKLEEKVRKLSGMVERLQAEVYGATAQTRGGR